MNRPHGQRSLGDIPVFLTDPTKSSVELAPNAIDLGVIRLRGWQLHRLPPSATGNAAYLIRTNYEFEIAPDAAAPDWAEVRFAFPTLDGAAVVDAVPRTVIEPTAAGTYQLTEQYNFLVHDGQTRRWPAGSAANTIPLPPVEPRVHCLGVGSAEVGWRHSGSVPPGSQTGWFVLQAPPGYEQVSVVASGQYHLASSPAQRLRPASRRDAFDVPLPRSSPAVIDTDDRPRVDGPRVFISYAHDTDAHKAAVAQLGELLAAGGVDVHIDQKGQEVRRDWDHWTNTQILRSDYVIVIASPAYRAASEGTLPPDTHLGVESEYHRLADLLHRRRQEWTRKILPVVLPGRAIEDIPLSFLPGIADRYEVPALDAAGIAHLLAVIRHNWPD
jgi:hypothetical protein